MRPFQRSLVSVPPRMATKNALRSACTASTAGGGSPRGHRAAGGQGRRLPLAARPDRHGLATGQVHAASLGCCDRVRARPDPGTHQGRVARGACRRAGRRQSRAPAARSGEPTPTSLGRPSATGSRPCANAPPVAAGRGSPLRSRCCWSAPKGLVYSEDAT